ncbi:MAG: hypothetical protein JWO25_2243 [Alphaproteobacteria bacterium]|nr:hypothetical protein [Alphaproteobacteria bacterium]
MDESLGRGGESAAGAKLGRGGLRGFSPSSRSSASVQPAATPPADVGMARGPARPHWPVRLPVSDAQRLEKAPPRPNICAGNGLPPIMRGAGQSLSCHAPALARPVGRPESPARRQAKRKRAGKSPARLRLQGCGACAGGAVAAGRIEYVLGRLRVDAGIVGVDRDEHSALRDAVLVISRILG